MQFKTYKPEKFTRLVDCFWFLEHYGKPVEVITPPNQYINLTFSLGSGYFRDDGDYGGAVIDGLSLRSKRFTYFDGNRVIGIKFFPYGLYAFLPELAKTLNNNSFSLASIVGKTAVKNIIMKLQNAESEQEIVFLLTNFLSSLYNKRKFDKIGLVEEGYNFFHCPDELGSVIDFVKSSSSNYTTLNRHFSQITGVSTKKMERLVRFRKALCNLTNTDLSLTQIGYRNGYFDQSHFIREFIAFMNMNPKTYQQAISSNNKGYKFNYNFSLL